ncbi:MAG: hypothetical protein ACLFUS_12610 [Candidatus Sumerlaeia bacterium]
MVRIDRKKIHLAFDMHGCPNVCRHCWLGAQRHLPMREADVRDITRMFREFRKSGEDAPFFESVVVSTAFREPDYSNQYRELYELEKELSDEAPPRYELLSVWRLARDESYAPWAKDIGTEKCQLTFFGMEKVDDYFHRREGAFQDSLIATERLIDAGILPRWQLFLTQRILPDVDGLMGLVRDRRLYERCREMGREFELFIHPPGPEGEGRHIERLRPKMNETRDLPEALMDASRKYFGRETLWYPEAELYGELADDESPCDESTPDSLHFFVLPNFDIYTNIGTLEPWWQLGNLEEQDVGELVAIVEGDGIPALRKRANLSKSFLAKRHGDAQGQKVYSCKEDLLSLYLARECEAEFGREQ